MKNDLTIAKIKHTDFAELYDKFIIGKKLNQKQYETLLAIAICFTNADDINVQQWGYRIVVEYCNQTQDYMPLYEIAINKGLYPVSKFIERHYIDDDQRNFFTEWNDAFTEQYISGDICRSEQQDALIKFFEKKYNNTISISAPTSYGKSELILSTIKEYKGRKICVLTSTKALLTQTKKRIQQISKGIFPKVVVHPEMYNSKDVSCLAVLTQERLLRVLKKDPALAFDCIIVDEAHELFIKYLPENGTDSLRRLSNKEARKFYAMMFEWRVENKSYSEMISLFFGYWHQLYRKNRNVMVYVGKWGDVKQEGSNVARYTKFIGKNRTQVVNLAIVRIKEEQDFMDNMLIKYVEVLHDLDLIENRFYSRIKYGTDDESAICLIKNGLSLSSATLLIKKYSDYLQINLLESTVTYDENIILKMNEREENEIQIYEVQNCM